MMKRVLGLVLAGMMAAGVTACFADGCCSGAAKSGACTDAFGKLNLSDRQKVEVAELQAQCKNAVSTSESRQMMADGLEKILKPDQLAQWNAQKSGGCPYMKAHAADSKS